MNDTKRKPIIDDAAHLVATLQEAYREVLEMLPWMAVICVIPLPVSLLALYRWTARMETAGFTDYPALPWIQFQSAVFAVVIVCGTIAHLCMPVRMPPMRARALQIFAVVVFAEMVLSWLGFVSLFIDECPGKAAVVVLAPQRDAVANYNRGFCQAWCRQDPAALAALSRGDCGGTNDPQETTTVYDSVVVIDDVREWCTQAVALNDYALTASHSGTSPFAGLKGVDGCRVNDTKLSIPFTIANVLATVLLFKFSAAYWRATVAAAQQQAPGGYTKLASE